MSFSPFSCRIILPSPVIESPYSLHPSAMSLHCLFSVGLPSCLLPSLCCQPTFVSRPLFVSCVLPSWVYVRTFIHYENLYSAPSKLLPRSAPDPRTAKEKSFEARVKCVRKNPGEQSLRQRKPIPHRGANHRECDMSYLLWFRLITYTVSIS